ncbi:unnamed protein product [Allacma fusca]|uniref:RRM domain-containing protein n=1 Tax=Allacma fusca TaxID=39272 RepID=A0A8J2PW07_9HEXA|nr:unnamed protein product [Allacma fusca]
MDPKKCISVFNLNYNYVKDDDLKCLFSIFRHVTGVKIAWEKKHCVSEGYAFVYFSSEEAALIAQREVHGMAHPPPARISRRVKNANFPTPQTFPAVFSKTRA